jgi:general secretion pathway protein D
VSLFLSGISLEAALQAMCRSHDLWMNVSPEGVVIISTLKQHLASETVYSDDYMETLTVKYPSVNDVGDTLKGLFRDRIVWERMDEDDVDPIEDIQRAISRMAELADNGQFDIVDLDSSSGSSRSSSSSSSSSQYAEGEDLKQMTTLQQSEDYVRSQMANRMGVGTTAAQSVSLIYLSALPEINTLLVRSSDRNAVQLVKEAVASIDKPRGQVLLQVNVISVLLDDALETGVEWLFEDTAGDGTASAGFADSLIETFSGDSTDYVSGTPIVSYVGDTLQARITALAETENVRELASPTLLVADNEAANVFVGTEATLLDQVEPASYVYSDGELISYSEASPTFEDVNIGLSLLITPRIHANHSVTLRILHERSEEADGLRTIDYGDGTLDVQDIDQQVVTSTLVAEDNSLIVLGGMITETETETESGIPLLKDIPLLGRLFSSQSDQTVREELMVLIRPHVIAVPGDGEEVSRRVLKDLGISPDFSVSKEGETEK